MDNNPFHGVEGLSQIIDSPIGMGTLHNIEYNNISSELAAIIVRYLLKKQTKDDKNLLKEIYSSMYFKTKSKKPERRIREDTYIKTGIKNFKVRIRKTFEAKMEDGGFVLYYQKKFQKSDDDKHKNKLKVFIGPIPNSVHTPIYNNQQHHRCPSQMVEYLRLKGYYLNKKDMIHQFPDCTGCMGLKRGKYKKRASKQNAEGQPQSARQQQEDDDHDHDDHDDNDSHDDHDEREEESSSPPPQSSQPISSTPHQPPTPMLSKFIKELPQSNPNSFTNIQKINCFVPFTAIDEKTQTFSPLLTNNIFSFNNNSETTPTSTPNNNTINQSESAENNSDENNSAINSETERDNHSESQTNGTEDSTSEENNSDIEEEDTQSSQATLTSKFVELEQRTLNEKVFKFTKAPTTPIKHTKRGEKTFDKNFLSSTLMGKKRKSKEKEKEKEKEEQTKKKKKKKK